MVESVLIVVTVIGWCVILFTLAIGVGALSLILKYGCKRVQEKLKELE